MRIREIIKSYKPYELEPTNEEIALKTGLKPEQIIRFDTNTSPFSPKYLLKQLASKLESLKVNEYPGASYIEIRKDLACYLDKDVEEIMVTNGADEALDIIAKIFVDLGTEAIVSSPTYSMYRIAIAALGGSIVNIQRKSDFSDDVESILKSINDKTRLIFLCSPNNPTGNISHRKDILSLIENVECPIIIDESYVEFSSQSLIDLTSRYENLIIIRTFSKAFALAGVRVGYIVANKKTVQLFNIMRPPYNVSVISLALAKAALDNLSYFRKMVNVIVKERKRFSILLEKINGLQVYPSHANFIMVRIKEKRASDISQKLLENGFVVRDLNGTPTLENCLRFTVRKPYENNALLKVLKNALESLNLK